VARVLYVSQYFVGADQPGGVRHWQHCQALVRAGHDVTVVTSYVQHKERTVPERYQGKRMVREEEDGLVVWRTYSTPGYGRDLRSRLSSYTSFALWGGLAAMKAGKHDVVVASSPPLPAAAAAALIARGRRSTFILEVRDLWPDSAVAMGLVTNRRIIGVARRMEHYCYRSASRIVALTEGIRDGVVEQGVNPSKITLITNGIDITTGPSNGAGSVLVPDGAFVAMYLGAHGTYSSLGTVLDAAERLRGRDDIRFVLVGGGDQKPGLVDDARRRNLHNVTFVDPVPKRDVPSYLSRADVCILPYQDKELFAGALPNKTFDYMGAERPILAAVRPGEVSQLVETAACGVTVPPEDAAAMAQAVERMAADRPGSRRMGENGGTYVRAHYDRAVLAEKFVKVVESVV
jgi:glycosyltransferase involved in cell wall biosynthesis